MMMTCTRRNENPLTVFEDVFGSLFNDSFGTPTKTTQTERSGARRWISSSRPTPTR